MTEQEMEEDQFDEEVDALITQIEPLITGKNFGVVVHALAELLIGGVDECDETAYIHEVIQDMGCPACKQRTMVH